MTEIIGWASSFILLLTIGRQIRKQWRDDSSGGVSKWLFYVFIATNILMLLSTFLG